MSAVADRLQERGLLELQLWWAPEDAMAKTQNAQTKVMSLKKK
jgi:hypothetical protein